MGGWLYGCNGTQINTLSNAQHTPLLATTCIPNLIASHDTSCRQLLSHGTKDFDPSLFVNWRILDFALWKYMNMLYTKSTLNMTLVIRLKLTCIIYFAIISSSHWQKRVLCTSKIMFAGFGCKIFKWQWQSLVHLVLAGSSIILCSSFHDPLFQTPYVIYKLLSM